MTERLIGEKKLEISSSLSFIGERFYLVNRRFFMDEDTARAVERRFQNNSYLSGAHIFGNERPMSAFFTLYRGALQIEYGLVNEVGEAKLHEFLRSKIDYHARVQNGAILRSGHFGSIEKGRGGPKICVALLDGYCSWENLNSGSDNCNLVVSLLNNKIFPLTSDGYPIRIKKNGSVEV